MKRVILQEKLFIVFECDLIRHVPDQMDIFVHFHSGVFLFLHIKQGPEIVFLVFHDLIFGLFKHRELISVRIMWKP